MAKTAKRNGWKALALFLAGVLVLGAAYATGYGITGKVNPIDWTKKEKPNTGHEHVFENGACTECGVNEPDSLYIDFESQSTGNLLSPARTASAPFMARATTSGDVMTVTATVRHSNGEAVADYFQSVIFEGVGDDFDSYFNLTSDGNTATVTCKQAFAGVREIKCTSLYNMDVTATYQMNYAQRPAVIGVNFGDYEGGSGRVSTNGALDGFAPTLKFTEYSHTHAEATNRRIKFLDSVEFGAGSIENDFSSFSITVSLTDGVKAELSSKFSSYISEFYDCTIGYRGENYSRVFTANMVRAISQDDLFAALLFNEDAVFGGSSKDIYHNFQSASTGQVYGSFINTLITYGNTGNNGGKAPLFNVSVNVTYKYGGATTFNYPVYAEFGDLSNITWNNSGHIF